MPKMSTISQLVSASLNRKTTAELFSGEANTTL